MDVLRWPIITRLLTLTILCIQVLACSKAEYGSEVFPVTKNECEASSLAQQFIVYWNDGRVSVIRAQNRDHFIHDFLKPNLHRIRRAEHDQWVAPVTSVNLVPTAQEAPQDWGQRTIQAAQLWNQGIYGKGALVAVVDSGVDIHHPQLESQIAVNEDEIPNNDIDDDGNGLVDDYYGYNFADDNGDVSDEIGHGTHVAGIIAARHDRGPVLGVAPEAKILPLKFLSTYGGSLGDALTSMKYASDFAQKRGLPLIINASWGGALCSETFKDVMIDLQAKQTLFIVAAGNSGNDIDDYPEYPAALEYPMQITVGALTDRGYTAGFSNFGSKHVHIMAPGQDIFSTYSLEPTRVLSGTSMAAPFVAGATALLWASATNATAENIKQALLIGAEPGAYAVQSQGYLNVAKAFDSLSVLLSHP